MTSLQKVQSWGVGTKIVTVALGILQTAIVLRILSPSQYGVVGIVISLGSLVGVSQHVGIVDATIREIAAAREAIKKVKLFWASLWFRLLITVPVSLILFLLAPFLAARFFPYPEVADSIRIISGALILQGIQGVLGGVYSGQRAFGRLYIIQMATAALNIPIFAGFTYWHGVSGFFEAMLVSTAIFSLLLILRLRVILGGIATHPRMIELPGIIREILHTGVWTYLAKIFSVSWQRIPLLILSAWLTPYSLGLFNVALTFGSKLVILAAAVSEVNLSYLSDAYARGKSMFTDLANRTLNEVGTVIILAAAFLALFADVILLVFAGEEYVLAAKVTVLVTWGYALFAFLEIGSNTIFVSSRKAQYKSFSFLALLAVTLTGVFLLQKIGLMAGGWALLLGGVCGVLAGHILSRLKLRFSLISSELYVLLVPATLVAVVSFLESPLYLRIILYLAVAGVIILPYAKKLRNINIPTHPHGS